jgi:hypothetical protein
MGTLRPVVLAVSLAACGPVLAGPDMSEPRMTGPSMTGQTGLIYMPDARIAPDGTWRMGFSYADPYSTLWSSLTVLPRLEIGLRYTQIDGVPAFPDRPETDYGDFKDKALDFKLVLAEEDRWWPSLAIGGQDLVEGTEVFKAGYVTANKRFGEFDFTLGYGKDRIDGAFGGIRYSPRWLPNWSLVAEYDANDYSKDWGSDLSGVSDREKDIVGGIEYRYKWVGVQASYGHDEFGVNAYMSIPLQQAQWVPKINEPAPYEKITPRPSMAQWQSDPKFEALMLQALYQQDFKDVRIEIEDYVVIVVLTNTRISQMSRAVGRAVRTILNLSPIETREIRITYTVADIPFATYSFLDMKKLERYFNGIIGRTDLAETVLVEYSEPDDVDVPKTKKDVIAAMEEEKKTAAHFMDPTEGDIVSFRSESSSLSRFKVSPQFDLFLNDPSGAFRYDLYLQAEYDRKLARKTFFTGAIRGTLIEDVSDVTQPSNSELPHVRTDVALYYQQGNAIRVDKLLLNRFFNPHQRVYARASAGIYEVMYSGAGGQVMYVPQQGNWATDLAVDWVQQRDYEGGFGHLDYNTVTAIGSVHWRMPYYGLTTTVRVGRFLAKDTGIRFELKRRFKSGIELGAWYTVTDANDITGPGSPDSPYYDKGVTMTIPLNVLLTRDTQAKAYGSIEPWTRDAGQMVQSPGDLYALFEDELRNKKDRDGLVRLGDLNDNPYVAPPPNYVKQDVNWDAFGYYITQGSDEVFSGNGLLYGLGSVAAIGLGYWVDDDVEERASEHQDDRFNRNMAEVGRWTTYGAVGFSALAALDRTNSRLSRTAVTSLESALLGLGSAAALQYAVGRAPPDLGLGKNDFESGRSFDESSFPDDLTTIAWATLTPYALEYDNPWLYGVATLSNLGSIAANRAWLSDTIAGSLLGWGVGALMWQLNREHDKNMPTVTVTPRSVHATWTY